MNPTTPKNFSRIFTLLLPLFVSAKSIRLSLVAFFNADGGNYRAQQILDDPHKGDLLRSSFSVIKKGTRRAIQTEWVDDVC